MPAGRVEVIRVYDDPGRHPGEHRALVDRLWPRGLAKQSVDFDEWAKEVAPTSGLRRWYGHDPARFTEFSRLYQAELSTGPASDAVTRLRGFAARARLVLLTATRDVEHSGAVVLQAVLQGRKPAAPSRPTSTGTTGTGATAGVMAAPRSSTNRSSARARPHTLPADAA